MQPALAVGRRLNAHHYNDRSALGELDRVIGEIDQYLAQPHGIARQMIRNVRGDVGPEFEAFLMGANAERLEHSAKIRAVLLGDLNRLQKQLSKPGLHGLPRLRSKILALLFPTLVVGDHIAH